MIRADKTKPLWRKTTRGSLYLAGKPRKRIKPNEKVRATEEELGKWIVEFELLDKGSGKNEFIPKSKEQVEEEKLNIPDKEEYMVEHVGQGWYNVVSPSGKVMNEKKLRSDDADTLRSQLSEETLLEE